MGLFKRKPKINTKYHRIEVEDLLDQSLTCSDISEELGITKEAVYRIKEARKRRYHYDKQRGNGSSAEFDIKAELQKLKRILRIN